MKTCANLTINEEKPIHGTNHEGVYVDGVHKYLDNIFSSKYPNDLEICAHALSVFLGLSKAFDTVNHNILLTKLSPYGIRGIPLEWRTSYVQNRSKYVHYLNENS